MKKAMENSIDRTTNHVTQLKLLSKLDISIGITHIARWKSKVKYY